MTKESLQVQIDDKAAGQRLDEFLAARLGWLSRLRIAALLDEGACTLNGTTAQAGRQLCVGDIVSLVFEDGAPGAMTPERFKLEICYEDEDLLVVVKPAGMLVHPTRGVKSGTLANALAYHLNKETLEAIDGGLAESNNAAAHVADFKAHPSNSLAVVRPGIVHRLDRATSGLMVIAKNQRALSILSRHFHHRLVEKRYVALVSGRVVEDESRITAPIGRADEGQPHWRVMESGKHAETRLRVLERRDNVTLIELEPVTGRTNQLRIHCAHAGHPVVGDEWYGAQSSAGERLCLHAARLAFHHPSGGTWMEFETPVPENSFQF
jgi:23S rRNA pseudouridine1911/1915/1917 synthase